MKKVLQDRKTSEPIGGKLDLVPNHSSMTKLCLHSDVFIFPLSYEHILGSFGWQIGLFILSTICFRSLSVFFFLFRLNYHSLKSTDVFIHI